MLRKAGAVADIFLRNAVFQIQHVQRIQHAAGNADPLCHGIVNSRVFSPGMVNGAQPRIGNELRVTKGCWVEHRHLFKSEIVLIDRNSMKSDSTMQERERGRTERTRGACSCGRNMLYFSKAENERVSRVGHEETIQKLDSCPRNRKAPRHACMLAAAQPRTHAGASPAIRCLRASR